MKYPRTPHLPWSPGVTSDDVRTVNVDHFIGKLVVITEKMDGENTTMTKDCVHARSLDSKHHPSRTFVKQIQSRIAGDIPVGWRICGENLQAKHSIHYNDLSDYFYVFSIWDENNNALSWTDTKEWCRLLELSVVPELVKPFVWNSNTVQRIRVNEQTQEGYVVRIADSFSYQDFSRCIAKWVRPNHVTTDKHWMHSEMILNNLKKRTL